MSQTEANMALGGMLAAPMICIIVGFVAAHILNKDRDSGNRVKWPIIAGFALAVMMLVGQITSKTSMAAPTMGEIERKKRAVGDVVENISFDRNIDLAAELPPLPFGDDILAAIGSEASSTLSAELPRRGVQLAGPLTAEANNLTFKGKKLYQIQIEGQLTNGQGPVFMLLISGPLKKGSGTLGCTSIDGQPFEFLNSPCSDEAVKFFELSGNKS